MLISLAKLVSGELPKTKKLAWRQLTTPVIRDSTSLTMKKNLVSAYINCIMDLNFSILSTSQTMPLLVPTNLFFLNSELSAAIEFFRSKLVPVPENIEFGLFISPKCIS